MHRHRSRLVAAPPSHVRPPKCPECFVPDALTYLHGGRLLHRGRPAGWPWDPGPRRRGWRAGEPPLGGACLRNAAVRALLGPAGTRARGSGALAARRPRLRRLRPARRLGVTMSPPPPRPGRRLAHHGTPAPWQGALAPSWPAREAARLPSLTPCGGGYPGSWHSRPGWRSGPVPSNSFHELHSSMASADMRRAVPPAARLLRRHPYFDFGPAAARGTPRRNWLSADHFP